MQQAVVKRRLMSLDALRGFDMFWILGGEAIFAALVTLTGWRGWLWFDGQMQHSEWNGFTFYDLIFPLFIFLSGVALGLSPKRLDQEPYVKRKSIYQHALKRLFLLIILGIIYNHGWGSGIPMQWDEIRYASVLGRIGLAWFFAAMIVWHCSLRWQLISTFMIVVGYALISLYFPVPEYGAGQLNAAQSVNAYIDQLLLPGISYQNRPLDPEGVLSTLPAIANALMGAIIGRLLIQSMNSEWHKVVLITGIGIILLLVGWLVDFIIPVNKDLWSSSFVLVSVGWSCILLAIFYVLVDLLNWHKLSFIFVVIGTNAIVIYLGTSLINWNYSASSIFGGLIATLPLSGQQLGAVISVLLIQWLLLFWLYRNKLFIKI